MSECASKGCGCTTEPIIQPTAPAPLATGSAQAVYRIENMDCPTEEALIRSKLAGLAGVAGLEFNLMQRTLAVQHELPSLSPVEQALKAIGMQAVRMDQASAEQTTKLSIAKMDCPTEETLIRNKLGTVAGVADLDFNLMQRTLSVRHANQVLPDVLVALQALGFEAHADQLVAAGHLLCNCIGGRGGLLAPQRQSLVGCRSGACRGLHGWPLHLQEGVDRAQEP